MLNGSIGSQREASLSEYEGLHRRCKLLSNSERIERWVADASKIPMKDFSSKQSIKAKESKLTVVSF